MRKYLMSVLVLVLGAAFANANSVDQAKAKQFGQQFVQANFSQVKADSELTLVYTGMTTRGDVCYYAFNVGNEGFVLVSADDFYRPIIGYSDEGTFDANINPNLAYKLNQMVENRSNRMTGEATPEVAAEWDLLMNHGQLLSKNGGRDVPYLVTTKWNQDSPYNYFAPEATGGPGGRAYAGCVATAMGQVMGYWEHPLQGTGSHSYVWHGQTLSANFGQTQYDWENMPVSISNSSPEEQKVAIGTLLYHCGVAVDMNFAADGSGASSNDVPGAISQYFGYSGAAVLRSRNSFSYEAWDAMLKESIDKGWPLYYSGCDNGSGCHAFVCDGYNDSDLFHWNWGWGGSGDGWYGFDEMDYSYSYDAAIFNYVPVEVYNSTAQAPTNFVVTPTSDVALSATLSWTNPSKTLSNSNLQSIDQIVVTRNGKVAYVENNPTPGANVTITDDNVPCYGVYKYKIYAIVNGAIGNSATVSDVSFGPTCAWSIVMTTTSFQGWRDAYIAVYNSANHIVATATTTNSTPSNLSVNVPLGYVRFAWVAGSGDVPTMSFTIKNANNQTVYTFSGSSTDMPEGVFLTINNDCGNGTPCEAPSNLYATSDGETITLTWDGVSDNGYGYNIYRDNVLYRLVQDNTFVDDDDAIGGFCYTVRVLCNAGESEATNESCANVGEGCNAPTDIWYEWTSSNKPKIVWERPEISDGLSGYYIYKRTDDTDWELAKLAGPSTTSYTDNKTLNDETWYYYKVQAYYQGIDCKSAPANNKYNDNMFYVRVYYSLDAIAENDATQTRIYPNPTSGKLNVEAEGMEMVSVFNMLGQKVVEISVNADQAEVDLSSLESGMYVVRVIGSDYEITKRVSVVK